MKIGIIGNVFVGKATMSLQCKDIEVISYDINPLLCVPLGTTLLDITKVDIIFISVPTPMESGGKCSLKYLNMVLDDLKKLVNLNEKIVVIRSTVPPGTSNKLNCYFMPEFLTEKRYLNDFKENNNWIFGLKGTNQDENFKKMIRELFEISYMYGNITSDNIHFLGNSEAEMVKLFRNNFLALKVSFSNEMEEFCSKSGILYNDVRKMAVLDDRIYDSHTNVPGHDGKRGFGGTCFPKDASNMLYEMNNINMKSYIVKSMIDRNVEVDRSDKDWELNKGRSVI